MDAEGLAEIWGYAAADCNGKWHRARQTLPRSEPVGAAMTIQYPAFKAAACHTSSVFLDAEKTAEKACDLIAEAARGGAELVVFPESFLPGFPIWAALQAPI